jgi:hypothetical protein
MTSQSTNQPTERTNEQTNKQQIIEIMESAVSIKLNSPSTIGL